MGSVMVSLLYIWMSRRRVFVSSITLTLSDSAAFPVRLASLAISSYTLLFVYSCSSESMPKADNLATIGIEDMPAQERRRDSSSGWSIRIIQVDWLLKPESLACFPPSKRLSGLRSAQKELWRGYISMRLMLAFAGALRWALTLSRMASTVSVNSKRSVVPC